LYFNCIFFVQLYISFLPRLRAHECIRHVLHVQEKQRGTNTASALASANCMCELHVIKICKKWKDSVHAASQGIRHPNVALHALHIISHHFMHAYVDMRIAMAK
jgi:hypothetical protein